MGLDISHDAWSGPYSSFHQWRKRVAKAIDIDLDSMIGFGGFLEWDALPPDVLHILLYHSDCDGEIAVEHLLPIAARLEEILPIMNASNEHYKEYRRSDWTDKTLQFIEGCRAAADANEPLDFH